MFASSSTFFVNTIFLLEYLFICVNPTAAQQRSTAPTQPSTVRARPHTRPVAIAPRRGTSRDTTRHDAGCMPRHEGRRGAGAWVARWWRALTAEVAATALLVWLGIASALPMEAGEKVPLAHVACAFGFVVAGCAAAFGEASGAHMNPAVSLAAALAGRLAWPAAAAYALAQTLGAVLGFAALQASLPAPAPAGVTQPARAVGPAAAVALEAALTGLLALACCAAWQAHDPRRPDTTVPLKIGLLVAGLVYAGGPATGASLNPARSFAPALLQGCWDHHWVYWAGPLGGAALAALLHRYVLTVPPATPGAPPAAAALEEVPLADKP